MIYRIFGRTGWEVSCIGQGCWNIGNQWGIISEAEADKIIKTAYEQGVNLFDVAESYGIPTGLSEIRLGKSLSGIRNNVYIVSKIGWWGARTGQVVPKTTIDMIRLCGYSCIGRLKTDRLDALLCHDADIKDPTIYIEGFEHLRKEGVIREYGISTDSLEVLKRFYDLSDGHCAIVELDYSLLNLLPEKGILPYCVEKGIAVLARGPLARGILSGKYSKDTYFKDNVRSNWNTGEKDRDAFLKKIEEVEEIKKNLNTAGIIEELSTMAIRYVISHSSSPVAIPGATSYRHVMNNATAGERLILKNDYKALLKNYNYNNKNEKI